MGCFPIKGLFPLGGRRVVTPPLPYDAEVEYLETDGGQYIYPIEPIASGAVRAKFYGLATSTGGKTLISSQGDQPSGTSGAASRRLAVVVSVGQSGGFIDRGTAGSRIQISSYTDPVDTGSIAFAIVPNSSTKFQLCSPTASSSFIGRLYLLQIWDANGVLIFDGVPVRVGSGSSAVGYLFDRVSGELFGNAGTGAFTIGPDK